MCIRDSPRGPEAPAPSKDLDGVVLDQAKWGAPKPGLERVRCLAVLAVMLRSSRGGGGCGGGDI
eukprot:12331581-Alexandrium_andersonii.AAC.1